MKRHFEDDARETPGAAEGRERLACFLATLAGLLDRPRDDETTLLEQGAKALASLVRHDDWLEDEFARCNAGRYRQYLLYCDPLRRFSVVSFVWGPGQRTPIHNHTTWGLIGMLRGAEISESFELRDGVPVANGQERLEPGDVTAVSPTIGDIHRVRNAYADKVSISIHAYGGDIGAIERQVFEPAGGVSAFRSGYSNRFLPNVWGLSELR